MSISRQKMEAVRLQAALDIAAGIKKSKLAAKYRISLTTANRWCRQYQELGSNGLKARKPPGRPNRLNPDQIEELKKLIENLGSKPGYLEISLMILQRFGIRYNRNHVGRMLPKIGIHLSDRAPKPKAI